MVVYNIVEQDKTDALPNHRKGGAKPFLLKLGDPAKVSVNMQPNQAV